MDFRTLSGAAAVAIGLGALALAAGDPPPATSSDKVTEPQVAQGVVNAPVGEVWSVFSTADGFKKLGPALCEMDFRIGGLIRSHYDPQGKLGDEGTIQNEFLAFEDERMVSFRIQKPPMLFPFSEASWKSAWTVVTFSDLGDDRTHLRIAGMGYPDTEDGRKMRAFFEQGNAWTVAHLQQQFDAAAPAPTAPTHAADPLAPVAFQRVIDLPRDEVWKLLATSEGWKESFGAAANIELRPAGKFEILFDPAAPQGQHGAEGCTVLSFIPGQLLSFTWNAPPKFEHARARYTWVVVRLDELAPARTRVRIDHLGFAEQAAENADHRGEWEQVRDYFQHAWVKVLDAVQAQEVNR